MVETRRPDTDASERAPKSAVRWVVPGDTVGRYLVVERIGEGGMGTVFAARDPRLDREVALKVIRADTGDSYRARVMREAQALARLSHPNVVPVFDVGIDLGIVWVAMQRVRGPTLSQWLEPRPRWPAVIEVFIDAGRGLAAAHAAGLVHRDFKPGNVMIDEDGRVMVLDFGLAWAPGADSQPGITRASMSVPGDTSPVPRMRSDSGRDPLAITLTATGAVVGTPPYMAPEQHAWHEVDARSDQYALCVSIFEGIYGRRPFVGDLEQLVAAKRAGAPQRPPDPPGPALDDRVWRVIERGMHPHPDKRWPDIPTLLDALSRARRRPRRWPLVVVGAAAVVTLGVAASGHADAPAQCRSIDVLDATWNDARRDTLRSAFASLGAASDASWPRVVTRIDDTVAKWRAQAEPACAAQDTTTDACLEHAASALDEGLVVLESADPGRAARAVRLIDGLAARSCDGSRLATPPLDDAMRRRQERVRALMIAGALDEAGEAAKQMLAEAHAQGDTRAVAWALILLGGSEMDRGEREAAQEHLRDALWTATAIGDDVALTTAATKLVHLCAYRFDTECAQPWLRNAEAGLARLGDAGAQARRELDLARGDTALRAAQFDEALGHYTRALESTRAASTDLAMLESTLVLAIGTVHASAGRHEQALQYFREAGDLEARELGRGDTARSYSLELSAGSLYALGRIAEARAALEESLANIEAAFGEGHPHAIRAKGNLVLLMLDGGELTEALALAQEIVALKKVAFGPDDIQVAIAIYNLGTVHTRAGDHAAALQRYDESLALWERSQGAGHLDLSSPLSGRTNALVELGRYAEAELAGTRARELFETHGVPVGGELLFDLGRAAWGSGRRDEAAPLIERARAALPEQERPGHLGRAGIDAWLAAHA